MILRDPYVDVNSVDLSGYVRALEMSEGAEQQDAAAGGDSFRWFEAGLQTGEITVDFWQDFGASLVDATLSPLLSDVDGFVLVLRPTQAVVSATNPSFTMTVNLASYTRFQGEIGDRIVARAEFALAADTGVVRAVA